LPQGWQQSDVDEHPGWKNGMQLVFATQPHVVVPGIVSHVSPAGQNPPQVPDASAPHGRTQSVDGPGQQVRPPAGLAQMHSCSHTPSRQWSAVQPFPSSQSASDWHIPPGSVVVVVVGGGHSSTQSSPLGQGAVGEHDCVVHWRVAMLRHVPSGGGGHRSVQISFGSVHGWRGEQSWSVHRPSTVTKHFPVGGGGGHSGTHSWFAGQGAVGEHEPPHCAVATSRQVPLGSGGGHTGTQISVVGSTNAPSAEPQG
jgi:hypothetical protein